MDKKVILFSKFKKIAGSRQIYPFEKLAKEIATIAKMLSFFIDLQKRRRVSVYGKK
jgi:hypothetical protein